MVLQHLSLMEERASHPLAQAIITGVKNEGVSVAPKDMVLEEHTILNGEGVRGIINGKAVINQKAQTLKQVLRRC